MISKELLSAVLGKEVMGNSRHGNREWYCLSEDQEMMPAQLNINIYELAHKCKEWASDNGYDLLTYIDRKDKTWYCDVLLEGWLPNKYYSKDGTNWDNKSEPEAIFRACQWILEDKQ